MEFKIDLNDRLAKDAVESSLNKTIMAGAVSHILDELTPERMEVFVSAMLDKAFSEFRTWEIGKAISEEAKPILQKAVKTPEMRARIEAAVNAGIEKALADLPGRVAEDITTAAMTGSKNRR